jgi:ubiquinone/menaquinone biosynthesis C-methylase UbiE
MGKIIRDVQARYDKIAGSYDNWDTVPEHLFYRSWRRKLWSRVEKGKILEIGTGTGKNIPFYPSGAQVTAIDISSKMLRKATERTGSRPDVTITLRTMDISKLAFDAGVFDAVVRSFLLMVAPDPTQALQEVTRVCKAGGKLLLLEFTRSTTPVTAFFQDLITRFTYAIYCAHINRDMMTLVERNDFRIVAVEQVLGGLVKVIEAAPS